MRMFNNRLAQATGEFLTQLPHRLGYSSQTGGRIGPLLLPLVEPLVKASVEVVAQLLPLAACAPLG
jgi:hypothetical protein